MNELATDTVWTVLVFVKLLTKFSLVPRGNVFLFLKLMLAVSKCASISVWAVLCLDPTLAQLGLDFEFVVPRHNATIAFECKGILAHSE